MSLSQTQQDEIFRILGYPAQGTAVPGNTGYPAFASALGIWQPYAVLLNRLNTLRTDEEVELYGGEHPDFGSFLQPASIALSLSTPSSIATGVMLMVDIDGTIISFLTQSGDTPTTVAARLASDVNADSTVSQSFMANAVGNVTNLYARAVGLDGNGYGVQAISSDPSLLVAIGGSPARAAVGYTAGGTNPPGPRFVPDGQADPVYGFVPIVRMLEADQINSRNNLDMESVGGAGGSSYVPRKNEVAGRSALLFQWRRRMADFLNVPIDPDLLGNRSRLRVRAR